jgi:arsenite methyltransferase
MMTSTNRLDAPNLESLRSAIQNEYKEVAIDPKRGFHFHTGRPLAQMLGYPDEWFEGLPKGSIESFAGTGNPFSLGSLRPGENVVDMGSGAGFDSLIAARMVAPAGQVVGVDMTQAMAAKAMQAAREARIDNVEFRIGYAEDLPIQNSWADVVISNGVINLVPDKSAAMAEMERVLKPGGRLQIGDILVQKAVPDSAKQETDLWVG